MFYIKGLNGLRAIAVLSVIFCHWGLPFSLQYKVSGGGVDLFFVISGFLITRILLIEKNSNSPYKKILKNFYIRRSLRIFPIYYLALTLLYILNYIDIREKFVYFATYTENIDVYINHSWNAWSHAWSLSVEEQFYLVWPFIILFIPRNKSKLTISIFILIGIIIQPLLWFITKNTFVFVIMPTCFSAFGIGALISCWHIDNEITKYLKYYKLLIPFSLILFLYWSIATNGGRFQYFERLNNSILSGYFILLCLTEKNKYYLAFLENKFLQKIGIVSYGLYLYHYAFPYYYDKAGYFFFKNNFNDFVNNSPNSNYFFRIFLLFILSLISYYTIEKFSLSFKKYFK